MEISGLKQRKGKEIIDADEQSREMVQGNKQSRKGLGLEPGAIFSRLMELRAENNYWWGKLDEEKEGVNLGARVVAESNRNQIFDLVVKQMIIGTPIKIFGNEWNAHRVNIHWGLVSMIGLSAIGIAGVRLFPEVFAANPVAWDCGVFLGYMTIVGMRKIKAMIDLWGFEVKRVGEFQPGEWENTEEDVAGKLNAIQESIEGIRVDLKKVGFDYTDLSVLTWVLHHLIAWTVVGTLLNLEVGAMSHDYEHTMVVHFMLTLLRFLGFFVCYMSFMKFRDV